MWTEHRYLLTHQTFRKLLVGGDGLLSCRSPEINRVKTFFSNVLLSVGGCSRKQATHEAQVETKKKPTLFYLALFCCTVVAARSIFALSAYHQHCKCITAATLCVGGPHGGRMGTKARSASLFPVGHSHLWKLGAPEFFGHRQTSMTRAPVEESTTGLGQTRRTGRLPVGCLSFHGVSGLCTNSLAHTGGSQVLGLRHAGDAWVSCSEGRTTACTPHARVALTVVSSVAPTPSTVHQTRTNICNAIGR